MKILIAVNNKKKSQNSSDSFVKKKNETTLNLKNKKRASKLFSERPRVYFLSQGTSKQKHCLEKYRMANTKETNYKYNYSTHLPERPANAVRWHAYHGSRSRPRSPAAGSLHCRLMPRYPALIYDLMTQWCSEYQVMLQMPLGLLSLFHDHLKKINK